MKVGITGHTSGIGLALYNKFKELGYEVVGLSRSTGHDIGIDTARSDILNTINDCDIFVNNAYHNSGQAALLESILNQWKNKNKIVIHISSIIVRMPDDLFVGFQSVLDYKFAKENSNSIAENYSGSVKLLNILPGFVKTNFYLIKLNPSVLNNAMEPEFVAEEIIKEMYFLNSERRSAEIIKTS
jgi:short-subunit dehydrogenase involved in D-alanine esterification of teichoic acids